jgi:hypothetical protein
VWTLAANTTYIMEGMYNITKTTNSVTTGLAFALGGSVTSIRYYVIAHNAALDTVTATNANTLVDQVSATVVNATSAANFNCYFRGLIRTNAAGTVTPQINFSGTTTAPVMKAGSYITFTPIGTDTNNIVGNVG